MVVLEAAVSRRGEVQRLGTTEQRRERELGSRRKMNAIVLIPNKSLAAS